MKVPEIDLDFLPQGAARELFIQVFEHLADWPMRSPETFRNACVGSNNNVMFGLSPMLDLHEKSQAEFLKKMIATTVAEGRMIDFGYLPNSAIIAESVRSRDMFENNEFVHPYPEWLGVSSWEGGYNGYHVSQNPYHPKETLVIELYGVSVPSNPRFDVIVVYDIVSIGVENRTTLISPIRSIMNETEDEIRARGSNSLDPLVTMLHILHDASIPITHTEPLTRLNRQRVKQGKPEIPSHISVDTRDYVANFQASNQSNAQRNVNGVNVRGTHASPTAHWRRSHMRTLHNGNVIPVRASKVNWRDTEELHRLFYKLGESHG